MSDQNEHVHIVLTAKQASKAFLEKLLGISQQLVNEQNVHVVSTSPIDGFENNIIEPFSCGSSPAVGLAGCRLYRLDPTAIMIVVDADSPSSATRLPVNFEKLVQAASEPGSMVGLGASHEADAGIYAWSIYALMETYRNYCPIDFQVLNEIAKVWDGEPTRIKDLYGKLANEPINVRLLGKVSPGYPTKNVVVAESTVNATAAPIRGGAVSDGAITPSPDKS